MANCAKFMSWDFTVCSWLTICGILAAVYIKICVWPTCTGTCVKIKRILSIMLKDSSYELSLSIMLITRSTPATP